MRQLPRLAVGDFVFARFAGMSMKHRLLFVRIFRHGHITSAVVSLCDVGLRRSQKQRMSGL